MVNTVPESEKFKKSKRITAKSEPIRLTGALPGERAAKGDVINEVVTVRDSDPSHKPRQIELKKKLAEGGEGSVYTTSLRGGFVAKIYRRDRLTSDRKGKIELMISKKIDCPGICFPEALVLNGNGEFIGYLMRKAKGYELGKSVFQPKLFLQKFKNWTKKDTIQLCITILQKIKYLNDRNVILGDINPANILVVSPKEVYFVDCDSYQVEGYPCPVGTVNFTPPEAQQWKSYKANLRTQEMENFAIATLLFMIMLPGKPPYSAVGGESQSKNIINGDFPYPLTEDTNKTPPGKWGFIWSHLSWKTKEAFFQTFKRGEKHFQPARRRNAEQWIEVFETYQHGLGNMIKNDPMANDIFPTRKKGDYVVEHRTCKSCGRLFDITKNHRDWEERKSKQEKDTVRVEVCQNCKDNKSRGFSYQTGSAGYQSGTTRSRGQASTSVSNRSAGYRSGSGQRGRQTSTANRSKIVSRGNVSKSVGAASTNTKKAQSRVTQSATEQFNRRVIIATLVAVVTLTVIAICFSGANTNHSTSTNTAATSNKVQTYQSYRSGLEEKTDVELAKEDSIMVFGNYPTTEDGKTKPIYWRFLSQTEDSMILCSVFVLDALPFNSKKGKCSWGKSSIRDWLNSNFINAAFTEKEREMLIPVDDKDSSALVSLMSIKQAEALGDDLTLYATPFATKRGVNASWQITNGNKEVVKDGTAEWWLRNSDSNSWAPIVAGMWYPNDEGEYYERQQTTMASGVVPVIRVPINNS